MEKEIKQLSEVLHSESWTKEELVESLLEVLDIAEDLTRQIEKLNNN